MTKVVLRSGSGYIADVWHTDVTFAASPPKFSVLSMLEPVPYGGDTMWTNQARVYASLSRRPYASISCTRTPSSRVSDRLVAISR